MAATQLLTQQGGWPNSVFLTPDLRPFYAGTYFPPAPRHGLPAFASVVQGLAEAWEKRRGDVLMQAEELEGAMRRFLEERGEPQQTAPPIEVALRSLEILGHRCDPRHGGFGGAPKFPTPANLYLLDAFADEDPKALEMLSITLDRMARGGIYDQLAGGFHRYATDEAWLVPHFEKMLYDNAHLLELYGRHATRTDDGEAARIASEIVTFLEREMSAPEGGFWSALDAESNGHEGAYHVWTRQEIDAELGLENSAFLAPILGFDDAPFFEGEYYVLHLPEPLAAQAERRHMGRDDLLAELEPLKAQLLAARHKRQAPRLDDKVLTDWNGMTISALATAGQAIGRPEWIERAARAANFILSELRFDGALAHGWRLGQARIPAFLADYVFLVRGLLALHEASGEERWLTEAVRLSEEQQARLGDPRGGFYSVGEQADVLFRSKEVFDGALPSTHGVAVLNLLELWRVSGEARWLEAAEKTLKAFAVLITERPDGARMLALATRRYHVLRAQAPSGQPAPSADDTDVVKATLSVEGADEDGWRSFRVSVAVREGWHVYAADVGAPLFAARLVVQGGELRSVVVPRGAEKDLSGSGDIVAVYDGSFAISGEVRVGEAEARLVLQAQPCTAARCLAPVELELSL